jgi:hypothetical protein
VSADLIAAQDWPAGSWSPEAAEDLHERLHDRIGLLAAPARPVLGALVDRHAPEVGGSGHVACSVCVDADECASEYPCTETQLIADGLGVPPHRPEY